MTVADETKLASGVSWNKPEPLQEFVNSRGATVRVDRQASVLRGVKLLGLTSRNRRRYREAALRKAMHLYEGAKVNVDHPKGDPLGPRAYRDRLGVLREVKLRAGDGLYAALHFNPKHPLAGQLVWDAEHSPDNVGLSHNVLTRTSKDSGGVVVESIDRVQSVDLVADPATTSGLFEQVQNDPSAQTWDALTLEQLALHRPDLYAEIAREHREQIDRQEAKLVELQSENAMVERRALIRRLLMEHKLPLPDESDLTKRHVTSDAFIESLEEAVDQQAVERLVVDRAMAVREAADSAALSREQQFVGPVAAAVDTAGFVAAVTGRG